MIYNNMRIQKISKINDSNIITIPNHFDTDYFLIEKKNNYFEIIPITLEKAIDIFLEKIDLLDEKEKEMIKKIATKYINGKKQIDKIILGLIAGYLEYKRRNDKMLKELISQDDLFFKLGVTTPSIRKYYKIWENELGKH